MKPARPAVGAAILFVLVAGVGLLLVRQGEHIRLRAERESVAQVAAGAAVSLQQEVERSMSATFALAAVIQAYGGIEDFELLAARMFPLYGGVEALQLAPAGVVRQVYPLKGNEAALGHDLLADPARSTEAREAVQSRRLVVAGPFELRQRGTGLVGRLPVFLPAAAGAPTDRFWGFVIAVVRLPVLVETSRLGQLGGAGYAWELSRSSPDGGGRHPFARIGGPPTDPVTIDVALPNGTWQLAVAPAGGWRYEQGAALRYARLLLLSAVLAALTFVALRQRETVARAQELATANARLAADVAERRRTETALRQSEEALRESEERFRLAFRTSPDAININRLADGVFVAVNEGFTRLTGWDEADVLGRSSLEIDIWDDPADRSRLLERLTQDGHVQNLEARFRMKDGRVLHGLMSARRIALLGQDHILSLTRDVSDWKRAEEERDRLKSELHQAAKMQAVGQLAGGVAHDFNNLLTVILSCAEVLSEPAAHPEEVDDIRAAAERARDLTRQLLAFARRQVIAPVPLDLNALVRGTEKMLRRLLGEDVELTTVLQPDVWAVRCDPGQVEQVILNLALNARDAMPSGGTLALETANVEVDPEPAASRPWMREGQHVRITLRDTGHGMSPEVKDHLFEPFFTTKPEGRGTGLGLATVYGIVKQSGGYIEADSVPGQGTTFDIYLPRTTERVASSSPSPRSVASRGAETILVVEDDAQVRAVTVRSLQSAGYRVLTAGDAREAMDVASRHVARLHLLVTDVIIPGGNGRTVAEGLRGLKPDLRVLYVSGYTKDVLAERGALPAGIELLPKPFTASSLLERVRGILDRP